MGEFHKLFVEAHRGRSYSLSLDSGTNAGHRTLNISVLVDGVSRVVSVSRHDETGFTADALCLQIRTILLTLPQMKLSALISDNAANVRLACNIMAKETLALQCSCACHCINLMVTNILYTWELVDNARKILPIARAQADIRIPPEIDTRWVGCFDAIEAVVKFGANLVFKGILTRDQVDLADRVLKILTPFRDSVRKCERDCDTIFTAVSVYGLLFPKVEKDIEFPISRHSIPGWRKNWSGVLVSAKRTSSCI